LIPILVRTLRVPTLVLLILLLPILAALVLLIPGLALVLLVRTLWVAALVVLALLIPILALVLLTVRHGVSPIGDASATQPTRRPRTFAPKQPASKPKFSSGTCSLHKRFRSPYDSINA
jgi:uncharacterized sodium:solute symporter family permease YidK